MRVFDKLEIPINFLRAVLTFVAFIADHRNLFKLKERSLFLWGEATLFVNLVGWIIPGLALLYENS